MLISDLHYYEPKDIKKYQFILEEINAKKPDYCIIAGDLLDSSKVVHENFFINFIKACSLETTILIGVGNHDITYLKGKETLYDRNKEFWRQLNKIENVFVLDNKKYESEEVCIHGITLPYTYYYGELERGNFFNQYLDKISSQKLNILLIHDANSIYDRNTDSYDMILSGHTHNGMIPRLLEPLAKNRGLISPAKKLFPKKVRGRIQLNHTDVIISGGITKLSKRSHLHFLDKYWNHEITMITIKPK